MTQLSPAAASFLASHAPALPHALPHEAAANIGPADPCTKISGKALADNQSYLTLYLDSGAGAAVASLSRPAAFGDSGPAAGLYRLALTDGRLVAAFASCPSIRAIRAALAAYIGATIPAELAAIWEETYLLESFESNWAAAGAAAYLIFKAGALTRAAIWGRRLGLIQAAALAAAWEEAQEEGRAQEAAALAADLAAESFDGMATTRDWTRKAPAAAAMDSTDRAKERAAAVRAAFALPPVYPAIEKPLRPLGRDSRLAVAAYGRGAF